MFFGIAGIVLVAFIATAATDNVWDGFVASWDRDPTTHFYHLPKELHAAKNEGWTNVEGVNPAEGITALGFKGDPTLVLLFKDVGVIGVQLAIPVDDLSPNQPLDWDKLDPVIKKTLNGVEFYTVTVWFSSDESTDSRRIQFQEKNGLLEIPTKASLVPSETQYLLKNCIPTMGTHYYTWDPSSDCSTLYPWFLVALEDNIIGVGLQGLGNLPKIGDRVWWETIPDGAIYAAMDDPPPCVVSATSEFGVISLHIWFVDKPQNITCS